MAGCSTVRQQTRRPSGSSHAQAHLEDLDDVAELVDLAAREGEVIYAFHEPLAGWHTSGR